MTISPPIRILAVVGVVAAIALGVFVFMSKRSSSDSSNSAAPAAVPAANASPTQPTTQKPVTAKVAAKPKIVLTPGLPAPIARKLQHSRVLVVSLFSRGGNGDRAAVAEARAGAKSVHAAFLAVNVADERSAHKFGTFVGTNTAPPAVLVVKRPGKITNRFDGFTDSDLVAQAAANAGAHAK
jgi:hypothetical protein